MRLLTYGLCLMSFACSNKSDDTGSGVLNESDADADADTDADTDADADADADTDADTIEIAGTWIDMYAITHTISDAYWSYQGFSDPVLDFNNEEGWVITNSSTMYYRTRWIWESDTRWYWCVTAVDTSLASLEDYGPIDPDDLATGCAGDLWAPMDPVSE